MHIGLVVYGSLDGTSGGFRYDRKLVEYLRAHGDRVDVISLPWRSYPKNILDGFSRSIRSRLDRPFDVLIEDGLCHPTLWRHNRRLSQPEAVVGLVHHVQSDDPTERFGRLMQPFERRYLDTVDATISTSEFTHRRAARLAPTITSQPSLVAPPAGRRDTPSAGSVSADRVAERAADGPLEMLFVGNLVPRKDPKTLLSAVEYANQSGLDDWTLTIVGSHDSSPAYAADVTAHAAKLGIDTQVEFTGELSTAALESAFERSHVCCVPSRYEGFGMVYLEAMEYGLVPIASAQGGAGEFVSHGHNGFLVSPGSPTAIARHLVMLGSDRSQLATLGQRALATASAHPTWNETLSAVRSFLQTVSNDTERS